MLLKGALAGAALLGIAGVAQSQIVIGGPGDGPPGCGDAGCGGPDNGAPQPLPPYTQRFDGYFRLYPGGAETTGALYNHQYQYYIPSVQAPMPVPAGGLTMGDAVSSISLNTIPLSPGIEPSVATSAHATFPDLTEVWNTYTALYTVHAATLSDADAIAAMVAANPAVAYAVGSYTLAATGSGVAEAYIQTGVELPRAYIANALGRCDPYGSIYHESITSGCGTHDYSVALALVRGDLFEVGGVPQSALDFYAMIQITATSEVSAEGGIEGSASAFVDPTIQFGPGFKTLDFTVTGGDGTQVATSFVPEPASWAMMIAGFGAIGGALRRRTRTSALA
jgi:hypothetical protein